MTHRTPFDAIWSLAITATLTLSCLAFAYQSMGAVTIFGLPGPARSDDLVVHVTYLAALLLAASYGGVGLIGWICVRGRHRAIAPPWPRYRLLEGDDGERSNTLAWLSLAAAGVLPLVAIYACLYKYVRKSRVAKWDGGVALDPGFLGSRVKALEVDCPPSGSCLRMHPGRDAPEWFLMSDVALLSLLLLASVAWMIFLTAVWQSSAALENIER